MGFPTVPLQQNIIALYTPRSSIPIQWFIYMYSIFFFRIILQAFVWSDGADRRTDGLLMVQSSASSIKRLFQHPESVYVTPQHTYYVLCSIVKLHWPLLKSINRSRFTAIYFILGQNVSVSLSLSDPIQHQREFCFWINFKQTTSLKW
jgi:hypothetical protein